MPQHPPAPPAKRGERRPRSPRPRRPPQPLPPPSRPGQPLPGHSDPAQPSLTRVRPGRWSLLPPPSIPPSRISLRSGLIPPHTAPGQAGPPTPSLRTLRFSKSRASSLRSSRGPARALSPPARPSSPLRVGLAPQPTVTARPLFPPRLRGPLRGPTCPL